MGSRQAVIATDQEPCGDVGPDSERRQFPTRASDRVVRARFSASAASSGGTSW